MGKLYTENIEILKKYFENDENMVVDYCGISNCNDFHNYEDIIQFKYKIINEKKQMSKICDFITEYNNELDYDWYIKIRPDIKLLEKINFEILLEDAINARARVYYGPKRIMYGMSINGKGKWQNIGDCDYCPYEKTVILDDMLYIFHNNVVKAGGFEPCINDVYPEHEWFHTNVWKFRNIGLNVIGINMENTKHNTFSGNVNYPSDIPKNDKKFPMCFTKR